MRAWSHYIIGVFHLTIDGEETRRHLLAAHHLFTQADDSSGHALVFDGLATLAWRDGDVRTAMLLAGYVGNIERVTGTGRAKMNRNPAGFSPDFPAHEPALAVAFEQGRQLTLQQATALILPGERTINIEGREAGGFTDA